MMLWTWQGFEFDPLIARVDRSKSDFVMCPPSSDFLRAYAELDEILALPAERMHQYLWCYTTDSWPVHLHPWDERSVWPIDVPQDKVLALVDEPSWERLIGSGSVPVDLREQWQNEVWSQQFVGEQYSQELAKKEREYHDACPSRDDCLRALLSPTEAGRNVLALAPVPLDPSWIRPYDLSRRHPALARHVRASAY